MNRKRLYLLAVLISTVLMVVVAIFVYAQSDEDDTTEETCEWKLEVLQSTTLIAEVLFWDSCTGDIYHIYDHDNNDYLDLRSEKISL